METNKKAINKIIKLLVTIISAGILLAFSFPFLYRTGILMIIGNTSILGYMFGVSLIALLVFSTYILYKYLITLVEAFRNKKWKKASIMSFIIIALIAIALLTAFIMGYKFRNMCLYFLYIVGVICVPLVVLCFAILNYEQNKKKKIIKISIIIILTIVIYMINIQMVDNCAEMLVKLIQNNSITELLKTKKDLTKENYKNYTILDLDIYIQKMASNNYVSKTDIQNILKIANSMSNEVKIVYEDSSNNIKIETTNKQDNWKNKIEENLFGNYYKFKCDYESEDTKPTDIKNISIYIEKYQGTDRI